MRRLILILVSLLIISCGEDQPTDDDDTVQKKYTIEEIEQNHDWVEITDIDTLDLPCLWIDVYEMGELIRNDEDYKRLYEESVNYKNHSEMPYCEEDKNEIDINFNERSLILFNVSSNGGQPYFKRKIFKNTIENQIRYILEINKTSSTEENSGFIEVISIPKIAAQTVVKFDTLLYNVNM